MINTPGGKVYGIQLSLDIHNCDIERFTRDLLEKFFVELCDLIDMHKEDLHFWDYDGEDEEYEIAPEHLKGTSAVQFIRTSNITVHSLDEMKRVYLDIFSCKDFNEQTTYGFCEQYFKGRVVKSTLFYRK